MVGLPGRLDRIPFFKFHARLLLAGGLGYLFDALDVGIIAFLLPSLRSEWALSNPQLGLLAAASSVGGILGAQGAGLLADRMGRRAITMCSLAVYSLSTLGCAAAGSWQVFLMFRALAGVGNSAQSAVMAPYLAEFAGPTFRGRFVGGLTAFFSLGFILSAVIGYLIVPTGPSSWRIALVIAAAPIAMLVWWQRVLPESPRWLLLRGRNEEAERIVAHIEREYEASGRVLPAVKEAPPAAVAAPAHSLRKSRRHLPLLATICVLWFSIGFSYYAFFTWFPTLLVDRGLTVARSFGVSMGIYAAQLPGYLTAAWANDAIGRRRVVSLYMVIASVMSVVLAASATSAVLAAMIIAALFLSFFMNGAYAGIYAYTAELFPTHLRTSAQGTASAFSRVGAALSPVVVGFIYPSRGFAAVFYVTAICLLAGALSILFFGPETLGRSLEELSGDSTT